MKQKITNLLCQALNQAANELQKTIPSSFNFTIERPRDENHGDYSSNIALLLAKHLALPPRFIAEKLVSYLSHDPDIATIAIAGPGFINFTVSLDYLKSQLSAMWGMENCGVTPVANPETVVVDYSSPNLAKEMHVGHLRSTIIGDVLANLLVFKGYHVIRQNHVGDWGTQFGMLIAHLDDEKKKHSETVDLGDVEEFYKAAKQRFDNESGFANKARQWVVLLQAGDQHCLKLWRLFIELSLSHCHEIYQRLGVSLKPTDVRAESAYNPVLTTIITALQQQKLIQEHDGAQCVFLDGFEGKNKEPLPLIVQKKDGGFLYATTDLAAIEYRQNQLNASRVLYVVDARQALHFQQVFALAYKAGFARSNMQLEHISFGMVLDKSGKPFKSREGGVTKLSSLLDEAIKRAKVLIASKQTSRHTADELERMAYVLGISSIKYADLSKNRINDYVFDWDTMLSFEGNTAPYLLYANTRIHSLFAKANSCPEALVDALLLQEKTEIQLAKQLLLFPEVIDTIIVKAAPHMLCSYLYDLASVFSTFYEDCPILNQTDHAIKHSRLKLAAQTSRIMELGLSLLGIPSLKSM